MTSWEKVVRVGIDATSTATSVGFSAAKLGTKLGFSVTRGIASSAAGFTGSAVDYVLFGGNLGAGPALGGAVSTAITWAEQLALLPILIGESITSTSLVAAHTSVGALATLFPGSDEASFSLASFVTLVRREWANPGLAEHLPEDKYSATQVATALVAWGALQGVTAEWKEREHLRHLREIQVLDHAAPAPDHDARRDSRIRVNSDVIFPGAAGQVLTADIGNPPAPARSDSASLTIPGPSPGPTRPPPNRAATMAVPGVGLRRRGTRPSDAELKATLRRLSKLVLAGYGGASLLFFGVSPIPVASARGGGVAGQKSAEEARLADAIATAEAEAGADGAVPALDTSPERVEAGPETVTGAAYSWWNVLLGRHDHDIFQSFANHHVEEAGDALREQARMRTSSVVAGHENLMPRFWVLKDHSRRQVVLVIRGTMSLNELAVDLTCDPADFEPASAPPVSMATAAEPQPGLDAFAMPGQFGPSDDGPPPRRRSRVLSTAGGKEAEAAPGYEVHGGMLRMSRAMGGKGRPVHVAVRDALKRNKGYELILCGHSLGAGVAALLGLTWADPKTCLTVLSSGLPAGRRVSVYCFGPPCIADAALAELSTNLITSFVYSHDIVSRLSLGSMRDMTRAAMWLCEANTKEGAKGEGYSGVTKRALKWKTGFGSEDDPQWFMAMRKTLEANMHMTDLFPPGRVWWALRDGDLHPANRLRPDAAGGRSEHGESKVRVFEVLDRASVFGQITFSRDMLSSHLPHQYDRVLHELL